MATVEPDRKLVLRRVALGRDFCAQLEVVSGLDEQETLVLAPPDAEEGALVSPVPVKPGRRPRA